MKALTLASALVLGLLLSPSPAAAQLDRLLQGLGLGGLSDAKIGSAASCSSFGSSASPILSAA